MEEIKCTFLKYILSCHLHVDLAIVNPHSFYAVNFEMGMRLECVLWLSKEMAYKRFTRIEFTWLYVHLSIFINELLFDNLPIFSAQHLHHLPPCIMLIIFNMKLNWPIFNKVNVNSETILKLNSKMNSYLKSTTERNSSVAYLVSKWHSNRILMTKNK